MSLKILIVDDHKIVRKGVRLYMDNNEELEVVGEMESGYDAINFINNNAVDIVFMDINMVGMDGIQTTKRLLEINDQLKIIALTMHNDYQHIKATMDAGASGYLLKTCNERDVNEAIRTVIDDEIYYSREVAQTVMNNMAKKKPRGHGDMRTPLTRREKEIYQLIMKEYSNQEIADELFISVRTVEVHKRNLLEKTGAKNSTGLVLYAVKNQLFEDI
ncbi:MAG: response regulator transcription factor [Bacteroidota bacterium]